MDGAPLVVSRRRCLGTAFGVSTSHLLLSLRTSLRPNSLRGAKLTLATLDTVQMLASCPALYARVVTRSC